MNRQLQEIAREFSARRKKSEVMALATLVRATGSSYLRPGARMLIAGRGETFGILSGGCIEEEVAARAEQVVRTGTPCLMNFDTRLRFGCSGSIDIFIERVDGENSFLNALSKALEERTEFAVITVFEPTGDFAFGSAELAGDYSSEGALIQHLDPPVQLLLLGAGPDCQPFMELAGTLGWTVNLMSDPHELEQNPPKADGRTVAVVKTHNYGRDFVFLRALLPLSLPYIGLIGSRKRKQQLAAALLDLGADLEAVETLHGPAGLDLGAEAPEEIALSVVSEIQAVLARRPHHSLRDRVAPPHRAVSSRAEAYLASLPPA